MAEVWALRRWLANPGHDEEFVGRWEAPVSAALDAGVAVSITLFRESGHPLSLWTPMRFDSAEAHAAYQARLEILTAERALDELAQFADTWFLETLAVARKG